MAMTKITMRNKDIIKKALDECGSNWQKACSILDNLISQKNSPPINVDIFNSVMKKCNYANEYGKTLEIFDSMLIKSETTNNGYIPNKVSFTYALKACEKENNIPKSIELLNQLIKNKNEKQTQFIYNSHAITSPIITPIKLCMKRKDFNQAYKLLLKTTNEFDINMDIKMINEILSEFVKNGKLKLVMDVFNNIINVESNYFKIKPDNVTYSTIINAYGKAGQWEKALEILNSMKSRGVEPHIYSFNAALSACANAYQWEKALKLFNSMESRGIIPDVYSYSAVITACGKCGQWEKAIELFNAMKVTPNIFTCNAVISACGKAGQWQEAIDIFNTMELKHNIKPDIVTYSAVISACKNGGQWQEAVDIFNSMESSMGNNHVQNNDSRSNRNNLSGVFLYSSIISACATGGQWELAFEYFYKMEKLNIQPNSITYNALIEACSKGLQYEKALDVLNSMSSYGVKPDVISFNTAISACEKAGQWEKALRILNSMEKTHGVKPNVISFNSAISACKQDGKWERALYILKSMSLTDEQGNTRSVTPDVITYNATMSVCEKGGQWLKALEIFDHEMEEEIKDNHSYNIAISACGKSKTVEYAEKAIQLLYKMQDNAENGKLLKRDKYTQGGRNDPSKTRSKYALSKTKYNNHHLRPDVFSFTNAIIACQNAGQWTKVLEIFELMKLNNISPNIINFNLAMTSCYKTQDYDQLFELFKVLKQINDKEVKNEHGSNTSSFNNNNHINNNHILIPNIQTYNLLMSACRKTNQIDKGLMIFHKIMNSTSKQNNNFKSNFEHILISKQDKDKDDDDSVHIVENKEESEKMSEVDKDFFFFSNEQLNLTPNLATYQEAIKLYHEQNQWEKSVELLEHLINTTEIESQTKHPHSSSHTKQTNRRSSLKNDYNSQSESGKIVLLYVFKEVIKLCLNNNQFHVANELLNVLMDMMTKEHEWLNSQLDEQHKSSKKQTLYNKKLDVKNNKASVFQQNGNKEDRKTFNILIELLELTNRHEEAIYLLRKVQTSHKYLDGYNQCFNFKFHENEHEKIIVGKFRNENLNKIDLHGYSLPVARTVLRCFIQSYLFQDDDVQLNDENIKSNKQLDDENIKLNDEVFFSFLEDDLISKNILLDVDNIEKLNPLPRLLVDRNQDYYVITGLGKHSLNHESVLQKEMAQFLKDEYKLEITHIPENPGRFLLKQSSLAQLLK